MISTKQELTASLNSDTLKKRNRLGSSVRGAMRGTRVLGVILIALLAGLWEVTHRLAERPPLSWPRFSDVALRMFEFVATGEVFEVLQPSLWRFLGGYSLAIFLGVALGMVMGLWRPIFNLFEPLVELLRPMPGAAIIPAAILLLGLDDSMKIAVITFSSVFPILVNTTSGVMSVDRVMIDTARTLGLTKRQTILKVFMPVASPYIAAGMRISLAVAVIMVIVTEMLTGGGGIGYFILASQRTFQVVDTYVGVVIIGILGYAMNRLFLYVENRTVGWSKGHGTL